MTKRCVPGNGQVLSTGAPALEAELERRLLTRFADVPGIVVAFSGGADSALVVAAAARALGPAQVCAVTAVSPSLPQVEHDPARAYAETLQVRYLQMATREMDRPGYRANGPDRCYFCKSELLDVVNPIAAELGWPVATGTNADDVVAGFRPGIRAAGERGALTPLAEAGFTKAEVRNLSRAWGLPTWDKPAAACLSSRIAYGLTITPQRLAQVERAEAAVREVCANRGRALVDVRVRDLGEGRSRVELDAASLAALSGADIEAVAVAVRRSGYAAVSLDEFRSGSMNDALRAAT